MEITKRNKRRKTKTKTKTVIMKEKGVKRMTRTKRKTKREREIEIEIEIEKRISETSTRHHHHRHHLHQEEIKIEIEKRIDIEIETETGIAEETKKKTNVQKGPDQIQVHEAKKDQDVRVPHLRRSKRQKRKRESKKKRMKTVNNTKPSSLSSALKFTRRWKRRISSNFFSHVGQVEDIKLIRDQRTGKSKGLCYVEFYERESILKAVGLSGQLIGGYPINIQITQIVDSPGKDDKANAMRLYVGSLHFNVTEQDLKPIFSAFGEIERIELQKDSATGTSRGFGFVHYTRESDAKQALASLNGLEIAGRPMKVGVVDIKSDDKNSSNKLDELEENDSGLAMTAQARTMLMQKLQRGTNLISRPGANSDPSSSSSSSSRLGLPAVIASSSVHLTMIQPTTCVVVKNMFDPKTSEEGFEDYIKEDIEEECLKHGTIKHFYLDNQSPGGMVYLRFPNSQVAENLVKAFHGRWYASRQVSAEFVAEATYLAKFPQAK